MSEQTDIVSTEFLSRCIDSHTRVVGEKPCEIYVPVSFLMLNGVKVTFHNEPWCATFDGEKLIQHTNPPEYK